MFLDPKLESALNALEAHYGRDSLELITIDFFRISFEDVEKISPNIGPICDKFCNWFENFSPNFCYLIVLDKEYLDLVAAPFYRVFFVVPSARREFFQAKIDVVRRGLQKAIRQYHPLAHIPRVECTHIKKSAVAVLEKEALRGGDPALVDPKFKNWLPKGYWGRQFSCEASIHGND